MKITAHSHFQQPVCWSLHTFAILDWAYLEAARYVYCNIPEICDVTGQSIFNLRKSISNCNLPRGPLPSSLQWEICVNN